MTTTEQKLIDICNVIQRTLDTEKVFFPRTRSDRGNIKDYVPKLTRQHIKNLIEDSLDIIDNHTINNWVHRLFRKRILEYDTGTQKSKRQKPFDKYVVNEDILKKYTLSSVQSTLTTCLDTNQVSNRLQKINGLNNTQSAQASLKKMLTTKKVHVLQ